MTETVILDPTDADVFHADVTCTDLWAVFARAEASFDPDADDLDADDPDVVVAQAQAEGLLVLDGVVGDMRRCRRCRTGAAAVIEPWPVAA